MKIFEPTAQLRTTMIGPVVLSSSDIAVLTLRKELERYIKLLLLGNVETLISGVPMNFEDHDVGNENDKHSKGAREGTRPPPPPPPPSHRRSPPLPLPLLHPRAATMAPDSPSHSRASRPPSSTPAAQVPPSSAAAMGISGSQSWASVVAQGADLGPAIDELWEDASAAGSDSSEGSFARRMRHLGVMVPKGKSKSSGSQSPSSRSRRYKSPSPSTSRSHCPTTDARRTRSRPWRADGEPVIGPPSGAEADAEEGWQLVQRKKSPKLKASPPPSSPPQQGKVPDDLVGKCFNCLAKDHSHDASTVKKWGTTQWAASDRDHHALPPR
ncbi:hypothetical protein EJB05_41258, partial [Eragrostis curvula]